MPTPKVNGYLQVALYKARSPRYRNVHRLVAQAFVPNPSGKPHVNHKDGNKQNNVPNNLEWVTPHENTQHGLVVGLLTVGESRYNAKLTEKDVREIRQSSDYLRTLADRYSVSISNIWNIKHRVSWKHVTP